MLKKAPVFKQDSYRSRIGRVNYLYKPDMIYARPWFSNLAVLAFVFVDLFCLKVVWNLVQTEDPLFIWCVAIACAVALDVPLAIAGIVMKRYDQGLCDKKEKNIILILSVAVFAIAFIFSFVFRLYTRDLSFDIGTGATLTNTLETAVTNQNAEEPSVIVAAAFNGIIPLLTSISSYVISYFGYDPLGMKIAKLETERIGLQSNILEAERALAQAETSEEYCRSLIARENDLYRTFQGRLMSDELGLKQLVRVLIMEKQKTPEEVTEIVRNGEDLIKSCHMGTAPERELLKYIDNQLETRDNNVVADFKDYIAI